MGLTRAMNAIMWAAERAGVELVEIDSTGRHMKAYIRKNGVTRFVTTSKSFTGQRVRYNIASDMRRAFDGK